MVIAVEPLQHRAAAAQRLCSENGNSPEELHPEEGKSEKQLSILFVNLWFKTAGLKHHLLQTWTGWNSGEWP